MNPKIVKAILFDWDLTLAHTIGVDSAEARLTMLFQQQGLPYTLDEMQQAQMQRPFIRQNPKATAVPQTKQAIKENYAALLHELHHPTVNDQLLEKLYYGYADLPTTLYPDVVPTILQLNAAGYELGIITNHTATVRKLIQQLVGDYFPPHTILISEEENIYKPNRDIFHLAAHRLGVLPEECVFIGDNQWVDAVGAVEQGDFQHGFWLNREGAKPSCALPSFVKTISSLRDIFALI